MIDSIRQFILDSLVEMDCDIEGIDDSSQLGPRGADLSSLSLAELALRVEDEYGVKFGEEETEKLAKLTVGRVLRRSWPSARQAPTRRTKPCGQPDIRAALAADPDVGAGNVLIKLIEHGADARRARASPSTPTVDGHPGLGRR